MRAWPILFLAGACTHHRSIAGVGSVAGKDVIVETYDGVDVNVTAEPAPDGLMFRGPTGYMDPAVVARVVERRHVRGAFEGLAIGAAIGVAGGAIIGYASGDDTCDSEGCWFTLSASDKAFLGGMFFGAIGGALGALVGLVRGSLYVYSYGPQVRVMPSGPPGSVGGLTITF
ncbi:MAG TPA: hypothetical protein VIV11_21845 [Kofleriaceae bacterium]